MIKFLSMVLCAATMPVMAQTDLIDYKPPLPYTPKFKMEKQNNVGIYPKLKDAPIWNGERKGFYSLKFKINGLKPGDEVYLADNYNGNKYLRDTTVVDKKGLATFEKNIRLQRGVYLFVMPEKRGFFEFIVADNLNFTIETDTNYYEQEYYTKMKVKDDEENAAFANYQIEKIKIAEKLIALDKLLADTTLSAPKKKAFNEQRNNIMRDKSNFDRKYINDNPTHFLSRFLNALIDIKVPEELPIDPKTGLADSAFPYKYYKAHYWDNVDLAEDGLIRAPIHIVKQKLDFYWDNVVILHPDSAYKAAKELVDRAENTVDLQRFMIWYHVNKFETSKIMGLDKAFVLLARETYLAGKAWWADSTTVANVGINARERGGSLVGNKGADLMLMTTSPQILENNNGSPWVKLYDLKAKYKILIFWDPTCGHCREVVPKLAEIYNKNMDKGWVVLGLTQEDKSKEFDEFMKAHPMVKNWIHLQRGTVPSKEYEANLRQYYVIASPTIFVLDEDNVIQANRMDVEKLEEFIEQLEKIKEYKKKAESKN